LGLPHRKGIAIDYIDRGRAPRRPRHERREPGIVLLYWPAMAT